MNLSSPWFSALCSVVFDLRVGQKIEHVVPHGALTAKEQADIAFHAFPDSLSQELRMCASVRDSSFFFRIRRQRVLYGFVFCRQRQDERLARGMDRRAIVVVSPFPFNSVLKPLSTFLGSVYFAEGTDGIERVYEQLLSWPSPHFCRHMQLKVAGHSINANLPPFAVFPPPAPSARTMQRNVSSFRNGVLRGTSVDIVEPSLALFSDVDVYGLFRNVLPRLWSLWELTITGRPLAIVAPSPVECSAAVAALISLISPIPYASDFRPFFTIHDPEFTKLLQVHDAKDIPDVSEWNQQRPTLVGVTNLYFIKALPLWPNVLSIGERQQIPNATLSSGSASKPSFRRFNPKTALQTLKSRTLGAQILLSQHVENLWTSGRQLLRPDFELCKELQLPSGSPGHQSEAIRQHFVALTAAFLEPFRGYFVPVEASEFVDGDDVILSLEASGLPEFERSEFLSSIVDWSFPRLLRDRFQSIYDLQLFYEQFLDSANFRVWFERQQRMVAADLGFPQTQRSGDLEYINAVDLPIVQNLTPSPSTRSRWNCTDEVKLVEEFRRLQSKLMDEMQEISPDNNNTTPSPSEQEFVHVFSAMPDDLRHILLSSPAQLDFLKRLQRIPDIQEYLPECIM